MAKRFNIQDLQVLLDQISIKTGESLDHYGLGKISEGLGESVSQKYLYDSLLRPIKNSQKNGVTELKLSEDKIDSLAKYLGFDNFKQFVIAVNQPISEVLKSLVGTYYSYVRKNAEQAVLLKSPVFIEEFNSEIRLILKGPQRTYQGILALQDGCVTCLMKAENKSFYHVYQVGKAIAPKVIQGIFSGVTSGDVPIGGRCVLIRIDSNSQELNNTTINTEDLKKSDSLLDKKLARYFETYERNNLRINVPVGFDLDDL
ncbi:MAG: hypothetical protein RLO81_09760 [Fulvivirga sp.]|uniref:hypothetical protein n=1 Tax=Fulvivirga sp. TaxID=1931237 RepID=UPI0032EAA2C3